MEKIFIERIEENKGLFTKKELETILNNFDLMSKIYILGIVNGKDIFGEK